MSKLKKPPHTLEIEKNFSLIISKEKNNKVKNNDAKLMKHR